MSTSAIEPLPVLSYENVVEEEAGATRTRRWIFRGGIVFGVCGFSSIVCFTANEVMRSISAITQLVPSQLQFIALYVGDAMCSAAVAWISAVALRGKMSVRIARRALLATLAGFVLIDALNVVYLARLLGGFGSGWLAFMSILVVQYLLGLLCPAMMFWGLRPTAGDHTQIVLRRLCVGGALFGLFNSLWAWLESPYAFDSMPPSLFWVRDGTRVAGAVMIICCVIAAFRSRPALLVTILLFLAFVFMASVDVTRDVVIYNRIGTVTVMSLCGMLVRHGATWMPILILLLIPIARSRGEADHSPAEITGSNPR